MDGKDLLRRVRNLLGEASTGSWLDERTTYDYLYSAAQQWVKETECLTSYQTITTVASTGTYTINGDYLSLYLKENDRYYLKYYDGTDYYFLYFKPYQEVIYDNNTTAVSIPAYFTITDDPTLDTLISDTADNAGVAVGGKSTLTMDTAVFTDVTPGDIIHNVTEVIPSNGVVISTESTFKILETALFGGTTNDWTEDDAFLIQPRKRFLLQFDPPPSTADHTVTFYYLRRPKPVYSDYDVYEIAYDYADALCKYAAWLYKYRDEEPNFGDAFYKYWDLQIKEYRRLTRKGLAKRSRIIPHWDR